MDLCQKTCLAVWFDLSASRLHEAGGVVQGVKICEVTHCKEIRVRTPVRLLSLRETGGQRVSVKYPPQSLSAKVSREGW